MLCWESALTKHNNNAYCDANIYEYTFSIRRKNDLHCCKYFLCPIKLVLLSCVGADEIIQSWCDHVDETAFHLVQFNYFSYHILTFFIISYPLLSSLILSYLLLSSLIFSYLLVSSLIFSYLLLSSLIFFSTNGRAGPMIKMFDVHRKNIKTNVVGESWWTQTEGSNMREDFWVPSGVSQKPSQKLSKGRPWSVLGGSQKEWKEEGGHIRFPAYIQCLGYVTAFQKTPPRTPRTHPRYLPQNSSISRPLGSSGRWGMMCAYSSDHVECDCLYWGYT